MYAFDEQYWTDRYKNNETGWDMAGISQPLKAYFDQLTDKDLKILIPGCGNAYEAEYLHKSGFRQVYLADISLTPLNTFFKRVPVFPKENLLHIDFFELQDSFDLIIEQTFFCALDPALRLAYVKKMNQLLQPKGKLVGLLFDALLNEDQPPFGGSKKEYEALFGQYFKLKTFEDCHNSIKPREGRELFINCQPLPIVP
jgi:methyl halide transferase